MAKKLDNLLEGILGKGGFRDASITSHAKSVKDLEDGIWALSDRCRVWRVSSPTVYIFLLPHYCLTFVWKMHFLASPYSSHPFRVIIREVFFAID